MKNIVIILAAGIGKRFGEKIPKQFFTVNGKMIIEYTLDAFQSNPEIDEIMVALPETCFYVADALRKYDKITAFVKGGAERYHSTLAVLESLKGRGECNLLFHDAVRPFVSQQIIHDVLDALKKHNAVVVATPAIDTIIEVDSEKIVTGIPQREYVYHAQTPQAFKYSTIQKAFDLALQESAFMPTDDGSVVFRYLPNEKIYIVQGERENHKITFEKDIILFNQREINER